MAKKEEEKKIVLEREYVIPLRSEFQKVPEYKRAKKAIKAIFEFIMRHMKVYDKDRTKIKIGRWLNEEIWGRGIRNPPAKILVKAMKYEDGIVKVELAKLSEKSKRIDELDKVKKETAEKKRKEEEEKKKQETPQTPHEEMVSKPQEKVGKEKEKLETHAEEKTEIMKKEQVKEEKSLIKPKKEIHRRVAMQK